MSSRDCLGVLEQRELIIATACVHMAGELKGIDPATFHLFFHAADMADVFERINQTVDRHFPSRTMSFACTGECVFSWEEAPLVALDFEFESDAVSAFFRLYFGDRGVAVTLHHIAFSDHSREPAANNQMLEDQLARAGKPAAA